MFKFVVLSVVLAVATANPSGLWGAGLAAPLATPLAAGWGTPWAAGVAAPWSAGVAAPLAAPVVAPLTAPVAAVAVRGSGHWLKKRSIVAAPVVAAPLAAAPLAWGRSAGWVAPAPVAVAAAAPIAPWGLGVGARVGQIW